MSHTSTSVADDFFYSQMMRLNERQEA